MSEKEISKKVVENKIAPCTCKHEYQDQKYGLGMRVWNHIPKKAPTPDVYCCTVCGRRK